MSRATQANKDSPSALDDDFDAESVPSSYLEESDAEDDDMMVKIIMFSQYYHKCEARLYFIDQATFISCPEQTKADTYAPQLS